MSNKTLLDAVMNIVRSETSLRSKSKRIANLLASAPFTDEDLADVIELVMRQSPKWKSK